MSLIIYGKHTFRRGDTMRLKDVRDLCERQRRRASAGMPELTETCGVRLSLADLQNLNMIRRATATTVTDSELLRALLRAAAGDLLGGYQE